MRNQDNGYPLLVKLLEEEHDLLTGLGIKIAGRLIGQDKRGIVYQGSCYSYSLLLAAS
jgi:hypothetical protein